MSAPATGRPGLVGGQATADGGDSTASSSTSVSRGGGGGGAGGGGAGGGAGAVAGGGAAGGTALGAREPAPVSESDADDRSVIVAYHDPNGLWARFEAPLQQHLPLHNLAWRTRSGGRNFHTIDDLDVRCLPASDAYFRASLLPREWCVHHTCTHTRTHGVTFILRCS